jgi:ribosomal protein L11 methyltransferase
LILKIKLFLILEQAQGILAILAGKLGAASVFAIDNDEWSIENAKENAEKNGCCVIDISLENEPCWERNF